MEQPLFLLFASIAVICGVNVVVQTHPIRSAISLIGVMGSLAVLYLLLGGEFLAAVQVVVYAGAIMVLFLFVIMLLNAGPESGGGRSWPAKLLGVPLLVVLLGLVSFLVQRMFPSSERVVFGVFAKGGPEDIGRVLFTRYLLPFEVTSVLVLVAILGAVVLARKEID
jgi:NADH-quinone oxidoreductase subunit J